jgi:CBS domain-containing protein
MGYTARDAMRTDVITVSVTMDLRELAKLFLDKGITGVPVLDRDGALAGVVSQTDLIFYSLSRDDALVIKSDFYQTARVDGSHIPAGFQVMDSNSGTVGDVMTPVVYSVNEDDSLETVADLMTQEHIHRVIVCEGSNITGIISSLDILKYFSPKD